MIFDKIQAAYNAEQERVIVIVKLEKDFEGDIETIKRLILNASKLEEMLSSYVRVHELYSCNSIEDCDMFDNATKLLEEIRNGR